MPNLIVENYTEIKDLRGRTPLECPVIHLKMGDRLVTCLLDSGASISCIQSEFVPVEVLSPLSGEILTATNLKPKGICVLALDVQATDTQARLTTGHTCVVCEALRSTIGVDILLGMDFLRQTRAVLWKERLLLL